jgi:hypothetical protein
MNSVYGEQSKHKKIMKTKFRMFRMFRKFSMNHAVHIFGGMERGKREALSV